jgi:NhaA family Na+:H+ antiporter
MESAPQDQSSFELPHEPIQRLTVPVNRFIHWQSSASVILAFFTLLALVAANSPWATLYHDLWELQLGFRIGSYQINLSLREWINDGLMTLFFFLVALELKREFTLGELRDFRQALLSLFAALGGMLIPAGIYLYITAGGAAQHGWGTVMSTDTAFVIGCLSLLKSRIPQSLRVFMVSLAIVDDIGAILMVAIGYGHDIQWGIMSLAVIAMIAMRGMLLLGIRNMALYFLVGACIWYMVKISGIHATVTGVILGLMTPTISWVSDRRLHTILGRIVSHPHGDHWSGDTADRRELQMAETAARETLSPLERLEIKLHPLVNFGIMPLFALANAGTPIALRDVNNLVTIAVFLGLTLGKPIGVLSFSWIAVRIGIAKLPASLKWSHIFGGGMLAGIGFTMALLIAQLAFPADLIHFAKLGILLASVVSAVLGMGFLFTSKK